MNKNVTAAALALVLAAGVAPISANEWGKTPQERQEHLDKKINKMTKDLNLTPDQQSTVRAAMEEKMSKMEAAEQDAKSKIQASLNADQSRKYDEMMKDKKDMKK
jgi:protein CpxP